MCAAGKKVILFAVPGAFTPTCSLKHLPGFIEKADEIKSKGVDNIACVSVNDAFVMDAWGKSAGAGDKIMMLADGNAQVPCAGCPGCRDLCTWYRAVLDLSLRLGGCFPMMPARYPVLFVMALCVLAHKRACTSPSPPPSPCPSVCPGAGRQLQPHY